MEEQRMSISDLQESEREEPQEREQGQVSEAEAHGYDVSKYERPSVTVDVVMMSLRQKDLQVLLVKRRAWPHEGMWAIPGGFVNMDESLEDAAKRELWEETQVENVYLEQLYTFGDPGRDPRTRVITVVYFALLDSERLQVKAASDAVDVDWFPVYDLPPLAFDHKKILEYTLNRLRGKLDYTTIAFNLLPEQFTLRELQRVYEMILHKRIDKRNFRKKVLSTGILEDTGAKKMEGTHRPARLYRFNPAAEHEL
ncbi:NUDIX hydrolase [Ktedonospora formicarum]|uniref:NUDIX hydrolase n=1 Tax=Ktedonospora formicarum TaxID=2778364 RepID=A0A8J3MSU7_9CHLR|nr:NUDIX domain-containing protein [Ktedonospora formicarum]GHO44983.1 NUDIX hydrolase [Ktedonospora formicarum]